MPSSNRCCAPLTPVDVVVSDNLGAHKATGVAERSSLYSPALNLIEKARSTFKQYDRSAKARTKPYGVLKPLAADKAQA